MPTVADLGHFNRLILAFYQANGYSDSTNVANWVGMSAADRQAVLDTYHASGIALMLSVFGGEDTPTTSGVDAASFASTIAAFVKQYSFDGVDIDYEDFDAMSAGTAAEWIEIFHTSLRSGLGDAYLISHAPIAPWFDTSESPDGGYASVWKSVGTTLDWFNVQFYNQGSSAYCDCTSLLTDSTSTTYPGTSINQLNAGLGIPFTKLAIGKPAVSKDADNGYMSPASLATCYSDVDQSVGVMFWEYTSAAVSWRCPFTWQSADKQDSGGAFELISTVLGGSSSGSTSDNGTTSSTGSTGQGLGDTAGSPATATYAIADSEATATNGGEASDGDSYESDTGPSTTPTND